jgi:hypothetical protein
MKVLSIAVATSPFAKANFMEKLVAPALALQAFLLRLWNDQSIATKQVLPMKASWSSQCWLLVIRDARRAQNKVGVVLISNPGTVKHARNVSTGMVLEFGHPRRSCRLETPRLGHCSDSRLITNKPEIRHIMTMNIR